MTEVADPTKNPELKTPLVNKTLRVSDFVNQKEVEKLHARNRERARAKKFSNADAIEAEILGRFGFSAWRAWDRGEIEFERMMRYLAAERSREAFSQIETDLVLANGFAACCPNPKAKKTLRGMQKVVKGKAERIKA